MFNKLNLFSKTEFKVLEFISCKSSELYEREIAVGAKVSPASANLILNRFSKNGLVKKVRRGRMSFYQANVDNPVLRQFKVFATIRNLEKVVKQASEFSSRIVLFGSCALGTNTDKSDVDLFVLSREKNEVKNILRNYPNIQAIVLNSVEYAALKEKDKAFFERINAGIELYGGVNG